MTLKEGVSRRTTLVAKSSFNPRTGSLDSPVALRASAAFSYLAPRVRSSSVAGAPAHGSRLLRGARTAGPDAIRPKRPLAELAPLRSWAEGRQRS